MNRGTPMDSDCFRKAFYKTLSYERGYSFDKYDKGGETYMGISRVYWPNWEGWTIIDQTILESKKLENVVQLSLLVKAFYKKNFWNRFIGDKVAGISCPVAMEVFDTSVNMGVHTAVKYLQRSLNLLNGNQSIYKDLIVDGLIGKATIKALQDYFTKRSLSKVEKEVILLNVMNTLQGYHYITIMEKHPEQERFWGWFKRL